MSQQFVQSSDRVLSNSCLQGDYWRLTLEIPEFSKTAQPGQFVHVQIPQLEGHILRRPFSLCDLQGDVLTLVYKIVGIGTEALTKVHSGDRLNVLGPLGHPFTPIPKGRHTCLLGGGFGCAAMLFSARRAIAQGCLPPNILLGARTKDDILLVEEFQALGCPVELSTDDGSCGAKGRITVLLERALKAHPDAWVAACGPMPMLKAVSLLTSQYPSCTCEVTLGESMACGVGACYGCVVKCKADNPQGWEYRRSCSDGPVFNARDLVW